MNFKILLVDDDAQQRKICVDAVELFNKKNNCELQIVEATSRKAGLEKLEERSHDAAIIDLRLENTDVSGQGNDLIREIKRSLRIPVRIVSGHLGDLDADLQEYSYFYQTYDRDNVNYDEIFSDLVAIYNTGITKILNNKGQIESNITNIFWRHISAILPEFIKYGREESEWNIEKVLVRYIAFHIQEYLELSIDNNFEPFHSIEHYIKPPVKDKIFTGDIVKNKNDKSFWLVVTPACDLATDAKRAEPKAEYITLVRIEDYDAVINGKNKGQISQLERNNADLKYHFLPDTILFKGGFINFQFISSVPIEEVKNNFEVELVISPPFKKDVISRFSAYYARQGQPVYSE